jgi:hypothetical protein
MNAWREGKTSYKAVSSFKSISAYIATLDVVVDVDVRGVVVEVEVCA